MPQPTSSESLGAAPRAAGASRDRQVVVSYDSYEDAERAVDLLADRDFPVEHVSIEARGLRFVENVTGRDSATRAAARAALGGLLFGALFGLFFGLLAFRDPVFSGVLLALYGAVLGGVVAAIMGAVGFSARHGGRDFRSASSMQADAYDVVVADAHAAAARALLEQEASRESGRG